ncbi:MAG: TetR/AcrR family transcriptional regulator [Thermomicrobiales bacterium]
MPRRPALTQEQIIDAAVRVADRGGLSRVSMRNVGREAGVEAMSLYHHLAGKEALLDALANWIYTQIMLPETQRPWRQEMEARAASARSALSLHPWTLGLIGSRRSPGPDELRHHEAVFACLRSNGFSLPMAIHTASALDAYVYGFVISELNMPFDAEEGMDEFIDEVQQVIPASDYPNLAETIAVHMIGQDFSYANEFEFGLDLILDSLERHLASTT